MIPLAEKMRPKILKEVVGQDANLSLIERTIKSGTPLSMVFWGPPGCGKTTLANIYAKAFDMHFVQLSAVFSGTGDIKKVIKEHQEAPLFNRGLLLFVDEIHRFNKAQQDAFLPYLENGTLILIGATTENPSFYLNDALLSRLRVITLNSLPPASLEELLTRYEETHTPLPLTKDARTQLISYAHGDGRYLMNLIENLAGCTDPLTPKDLDTLLQRRPALYDKKSDGHYNLISALHKAVRTSDPDSSLYWLARMLEGGEDPLFIARRLIRMASEDIGLADPQALQVTLSAREAYQMLGSPEGELALAEATVYLALAPKSNAVYMAYKEARTLAADTHDLPPPKHILNAPTSLMKAEGYGENYQYDHNHPNGCSGQNTFPDHLPPQSLYHPVPRGFEREMQKRLDYFRTLRSKLL